MDWPPLCVVMFAKFTSESFYALYRLIHQPLRGGNVFLKPLALAVASFFNVTNRTLIPNRVWAISLCGSRPIFFVCPPSPSEPAESDVATVAAGDLIPCAEFRPHYLARRLLFCNQ
jgi:hypothetical protein